MPTAFLTDIAVPVAASTGAPTTGAHVKGELYVDSAGALWICTAAGTPGTWVGSPTDSLLAHLAGTETITGAKTASALWTFNGGLLLAGATGLNVTTNLGGTNPSGAGGLIGWNFSNGTREVNFFNLDTLDAGDSFTWYQKTGASTQTLLAGLDYTGKFRVVGGLNLATSNKISWPVGSISIEADFYMHFDGRDWTWRDANAGYATRMSLSNAGVLVTNSPVGTGGLLRDWQVNGSSVASVDATGKGAFNRLSVTPPSSGGIASIAITAPAGFGDNLADWTVNSVSQFKVTGNGSVYPTGTIFVGSSAVAAITTANANDDMYIRTAGAGLIRFNYGGGTGGVAFHGGNTAAAVASIDNTGKATFNGGLVLPASAPISLTGSAGSSGQVLTSAGAGATPTWASSLVNPMTTVGDLIIGGAAGAATRLAASTSGFVLTAQGAGVAPIWAAASGAALTSTAPTTSAEGDAAAVGTGTTAAKADHVHGREAFGGAPGAMAAFGLGGAAGSATTPSRSDHVHSTPADPTGKALGLTGAVAATRYAGAVASGAPTTGTFAVGDFVIDQTGKVWVCTVAGTPGTWVQAGDPGYATPGNSAVGDVAAAGTATTLPRSDHVHGREAFGGAPGAMATFGLAGAAGAATTPSRSDHVHSTPVDPTGKSLLLTGAVAATRYVGGIASGAPTTGTFAVGDFVVDQTGKVWVCTVAGTPGTWVSAAPLASPTFTGTVSVNGLLAGGQSATAPAVASAGTIATAGVRVARVAPTAAVTGVILAAGTVAGQQVTVINEATTTTFSVTFAAAATSNVADGVSSVIPGLAASTFTWDSVTARWYRSR
ncbi:MAG: beta strand repeat-containing protein [Candidatus Dormibacteria bacterium]